MMVLMSVNKGVPHGSILRTLLLLQNLHFDLCDLILNDCYKNRSNEGNITTLHGTPINRVSLHKCFGFWLDD